MCDTTLPSFLLKARECTTQEVASKQYCSTVASVFHGGPTLILDSGCDHTVVSQGWKVLPETLYVCPDHPGLTPALGNSDTAVVEMKLGSAISTVLSLTGEPVCIIRVNQAFVLSSGSSESLLSEDQLRTMDVHIQKRKIDSILTSTEWKQPLEVHSTGCTSR